MGLFKRPDSPFWWMLLEGYGRRKENTGIRHDATSSAIRKQLQAQAEEVYHARMVQLARGRVGLPIESAVTFKEWASWYDAHHIARHKGAARERVILARLLEHFGSFLLQDIKAARWQEYQTARLAEGIAVNTVGRELALMKSMLRAAVGEHLEVSPLAHVQRKTTKLPPKRTITADEELRLIEALQPGKARGGTYGDDELLDLYLVGVGTLLRQMNLITLQRKQHRGDRLVVDTKTGPHQVPLTGPTPLQQRAAMVLKRRMPKTADGFFFPEWQARFAQVLKPGRRKRTTRDRSEDARAAANKLFLQAFRRACKRAGIPWGLKNHGVVWHTATRASGATRMLRDFGVDVRTVQVIGNWRSLDQMADYLGVDLQQLSATPKAAKRRRISA